MKEELDALLGAYVDGELDRGGAAEVEALLAADPAARARAAALRETGALLRAAFADGFFAADGERLIGRRTRRAGWPAPLAVAAALFAAVIGFGGGLVWGGEGATPRDALLDEVAEYHEVYSRETTHLVEVPAARADELQRWFGHRLERPVDIPDLSAWGLAFAGGRMLVAGGKPVADLLYTRAGGLPVALCITPFDGAPAGIGVEYRNGLRIAMWQDGRFAYLVVGELDAAAARAIAERAAAQLRG